MYTLVTEETKISPKDLAMVREAEVVERFSGVKADLATAGATPLAPSKTQE